MNEQQIRKYLKRLPSVSERLAARRQLGQSADEIAEYVCMLLINNRSQNHKGAPIDEDGLIAQLTPEEEAQVRRKIAKHWANRQYKALAKAAAARVRDAQSKIAEANNQSRQDVILAIRASMRQKGAITISEVARRLGLSVAAVRDLKNKGHLPPVARIPVQHSYGRPVDLWLPETIIRYLNRKKN